MRWDFGWTCSLTRGSFFRLWSTQSLIQAHQTSKSTGQQKDAIQELAAHRLVGHWTSFRNSLELCRSTRRVRVNVALFRSLGDLLPKGRHGRCLICNFCRISIQESRPSSTMFVNIGWNLLVLRPPPRSPPTLLPFCSSRRITKGQWSGSTSLADLNPGPTALEGICKTPPGNMINSPTWGGTQFLALCCRWTGTSNKKAQKCSILSWGQPWSPRRCKESLTNSSQERFYRWFMHSCACPVSGLLKLKCQASLPGWTFSPGFSTISWRHRSFKVSVALKSRMESSIFNRFNRLVWRWWRAFHLPRTFQSILSLSEWSCVTLLRRLMRGDPPKAVCYSHMPLAAALQWRGIAAMAFEQSQCAVRRGGSCK